MTNIEVRTRSIYNKLSNTERKVADYFLANTDSVFNMPISELAKSCNVSQVTWVRFCKDIGFDGLKDLKKSLFMELNDTVTDNVSGAQQMFFTDVSQPSSIAQMAETVKKSSMQAIEDTVKLINSNNMEQIASLIIKADSLKIFGLGASALVAEDFFNKLLRIGKNVCFCRDNHIQLTYAANLTGKDAALFISDSGTTQEILETLELAQKCGCPTIAITKFSKSPLVVAADYLLYTSSPEVYRRSGAMSSRIAQLILVDVLFTAIANYNFKDIENRLEKSYDICKTHKV